MNKIFLTGRLGKDPETHQGQAVNWARFTLAVDRRGKNDERATDWFSCVAFGKTGEVIFKHFGKGSRIAIEGRVQTGTWTDKNGNKRESFDVVVENFEFVDKKNEGGQSEAPQRRASQTGGGQSERRKVDMIPTPWDDIPVGAYEVDGEDDDLPF